MRILYIHTTLVPPPLDPQADRFFLLSENLEGEVLQPVWFKTAKEVEDVFGPGSYPGHTSGRFRYNWFLAYRYEGVRRRIAQFWFYLRRGLQLHREKPFDCIVSYSHMTPGVMGTILKLLTGARSVIEIATSPDLAYLTEHPKPTLGDRAMKLYSDLCLHFTLWLADGVHLLYPEQLDKYSWLRGVKRSVFHEFVPVSVIPDHRQDGGRFVLLVGAPWYLKGADRLIEAFRRLAPDFPEVRLKLLGWYPDRDKLEALTNGCGQIEILQARPHPEVLEIISRAEVLAQPSRCEGMGRVLVEAMGAGVPVLGSDAGGIPHILRDGEVGFLVPGGDPEGLEKRLRQLLADKALWSRMSAKGYEVAHTRLDERTYVARFTEMVEAAAGKT